MVDRSAIFSLQKLLNYIFLFFNIVIQSLVNEISTKVYANTENLDNFKVDMYNDVIFVLVFDPLADIDCTDLAPIRDKKILLSSVVHAPGTPYGRPYVQILDVR